MSSLRVKLTKILDTIHSCKGAGNSGIYTAVEERLTKAVTRYTKDLILSAQAVDAYDSYKVLKSIGQDQSKKND